MLLKLIVLLSASALTLAAPVEDVSTETIPNVEVLADLKHTKNSKDLAPTIADDDQKELNPDERLVIKDILDKLDKSDISKVMDEEKALNTKSSMKSDVTTVDTTKLSTKNMAVDSIDKESTIIKTSGSNPATENMAENSNDKVASTIIKTSGSNPATENMAENSNDKVASTIIKTSDSKPATKNVADNSDLKLASMIIKTSDSSDYIKKITEETDKKLKEVASAVSEVVTSLPVPAKPDTPSKYTEVVGHFISELLQIPMVLLHAVSNVIASLTNNKVNIPTPTFLVPVTQAPLH